MSSVSLRSATRLTVTARAPLPEVRTAPLSALTSRHDPMLPEVPDGSRITTRETVVAEPHLTETEPVDPAGCQYVLRLPSLTLP